MQIKNLEEKKLIKELKSNSESAFKLLIENYKDQIFNTIIPIIQNVDDADDVTQEVFIQIYKSIKKFKEKSSLSTWIYKISISKAYEYIRYNKRIKRFSILINMQFTIIILFLGCVFVPGRSRKIFFVADSVAILQGRCVDTTGSLSTITQAI